MRDSTLRPCPFCGGEAQLSDDQAMRAYGGVYVRCVDCGVKTTVEPVNRAYIADEKAVSLWNRRATDAEIERLRRERDAAVADLAELTSCESCKCAGVDGELEPCDSCSENASNYESDLLPNNWQWRGPQEEDKHE